MTDSTGNAAVVAGAGAGKGSGGGGSKYGKAMPIHISASREALHEKVVALAAKLNCRLTDIVWDALEKYVAVPPTVAPAGASPRGGSAPGFWLVHTLNKDGRLSGIAVREVKERPQADGKTFYRYAEGDEKGRARALAQVQRAAAYDAGLAGIKVPEGGFKVEVVK